MKPPLSLALLAEACLLSITATSPAIPAEPVSTRASVDPASSSDPSAGYPSGPRRASHSDKLKVNEEHMLTVGLGIFLPTYLGSALFGMASSDPTDRWFLVPVVGPVVGLNAWLEHGTGPADESEYALRLGPLYPFWTRAFRRLGSP